MGFIEKFAGHHLSQQVIAVRRSLSRNFPTMNPKSYRARSLYHCSHATSSSALPRGDFHYLWYSASTPQRGGLGERHYGRFWIETFVDASIEKDVSYETSLYAGRVGT